MSLTKKLNESFDALESFTLNEVDNNELYCIVATTNNGTEYKLTGLGDKQKIQKIWDKIFYDEYDRNEKYKQKLYRKVFPENLDGEKDVLFELVGGPADIMKQCAKTGFNVEGVVMYDDAQDTIHRYKTDEEIEASRANKNMVATIRLENMFSYHFNRYMTKEDMKKYEKEWTIVQSDDIEKIAKLFFAGVAAVVKYAGIENELIGDYVEIELKIADKDGKGPYDFNWARNAEEAIEYFNSKQDARGTLNSHYYKGNFYKEQYDAPYVNMCIVCGKEYECTGHMSVCKACDDKYLKHKGTGELEWTPEKFPVLFK